MHIYCMYVYINYNTMCIFWLLFAIWELMKFCLMKLAGKGAQAVWKYIPVTLRLSSRCNFAGIEHFHGREACNESEFQQLCWLRPVNSLGKIAFRRNFNPERQRRKKWARKRNRESLVIGLTFTSAGVAATVRSCSMPWYVDAPWSWFKAH